MEARLLPIPEREWVSAAKAFMKGRVKPLALAIGIEADSLRLICTYVL
jgi:hypothetical protein